MTREISNVNVVTDDINEPYGLYFSTWVSKDPHKNEMIIRISRTPEPDFKDMDKYERLHGIAEI